MSRLKRDIKKGGGGGLTYDCFEARHLLEFWVNEMRCVVDGELMSKAEVEIVFALILPCPVCAIVACVT